MDDLLVQIYFSYSQLLLRLRVLILVPKLEYPIPTFILYSNLSIPLFYDSPLLVL